MDRDWWYPLSTGLEWSHYWLLLQVVLKYFYMGRREKVRLCWVEWNSLNYTLGVVEWSCWIASGKRVDQNLTACLNIVSHCCEIVAFRVPANPTNDLPKVHFDHFEPKATIIFKLPFNVLFFLVWSFGVDIILLFPFIHICFSLFVQFLAKKLCLNHINELFVDSS